MIRSQSYCLCAQGPLIENITAYFGERNVAGKTLSGHRCGRTGSVLFGNDTESGNGICSSATTWVDCGLVGMHFLFNINLSFSAVNILERPVAPQSWRNRAQYPSSLHLQGILVYLCAMLRHKLINSSQISIHKNYQSTSTRVFAFFYCKLN